MSRKKVRWGERDKLFVGRQDMDKEVISLFLSGVAKNECDAYLMIYPEHKTKTFHLLIGKVRHLFWSYKSYIQSMQASAKIDRKRFEKYL